MQYKFQFKMTVACYISHGFTKDIYRSFPNLQKNANLQMHFFLMALEKWINQRGRFPDIINYQVSSITSLIYLTNVHSLMSSMTEDLKMAQKISWRYAIRWFIMVFVE